MAIASPAPNDTLALTWSGCSGAVANARVIAWGHRLETLIPRHEESCGRQKHSRSKPEEEKARQCSSQREKEQERQGSRVSCSALRFVAQIYR